LPLSGSPVSSPLRQQVLAAPPEVVQALGEGLAAVEAGVAAGMVAEAAGAMLAEVAPAAAGAMAAEVAQARTAEAAATEAAATRAAVTEPARDTPMAGVTPVRVLMALTVSWAMSLPVWAAAGWRRRETGTSPEAPS